MKYLVNRETKEHRLAPWIEDHARHGDTVIGCWYIVGADSEGWIKHSGYECPLPDDTACEFKHSERRPERHVLMTTRAQGLGWSVIQYYRPILDDKEEQRADFDRAAAQLIKEAEDEHYKSHTLIDRLRASHKAASELPDIISELREVLEPMGLGITYLSEFSAGNFAGNETEPDMTDWRNWREGDVLEVTSTSASDARIGVKSGDLVTVLQGSNQVPYCKTKNGETWAFIHSDLRFHSRPTKEQDK